MISLEESNRSTKEISSSIPVDEEVEEEKGLDTKKQGKLPKIHINTSRSRGELKLLKKLCEKNSIHGWKEVFGMNGHILWSGLQISNEDISISEHILCNRMPNMVDLAHKKVTGFFLNKFREYFPEDFKFFPKTYLIPEELSELDEYLKSHPNKLFIAKPTAGSQGDGIVLVRKITDIPQFKFHSGNTEMVVQRYIDRPLIIDGKKFDLRLYLLISSVKPLIAFLCDEGLARFCTEDYEAPNESNLKRYYMHLTNYSLNKMSPNFKHTDEISEINDGSKRTLASLWKSVEKAGYDKQVIINNIEELIRKFMVSMKPFIHLYYNSAFQGKDTGKCFQLLGFDVLLDYKLKPWLLEINANPSLSIDFEQDHPDGSFTSVPSAVDYYVKARAVEDALLIVRKTPEKQAELTTYRSYKLVYNSETSEYEQMNLIQDLLDVFGHLSGCRFKSSLTSSKFAKLGTYAGLTNDKFIKTDYDIIFSKLISQSDNRQMDFQTFIKAVELIASRLFADYDPKKKTSSIERLIERIKSNIN